MPRRLACKTPLRKDRVALSRGPQTWARIASGIFAQLRILGNLHRQRRQLDDLMPSRFGVVVGRRVRQVFLTHFAKVGDVPDGRLGEAFGRQPLAEVGSMSGLAAGFAAGGLFHHGLGGIKGIGRRRHGRIGGVDSQPRRQVTDESFQLSNTPFQLGSASVSRTTTWAKRNIHV
jgi:hypothetical protein